MYDFPRTFFLRNFFFKLFERHLTRIPISEYFFEHFFRVTFAAIGSINLIVSAINHKSNLIFHLFIFAKSFSIFPSAAIASMAAVKFLIKLNWNYRRRKEWKKRTHCAMALHRKGKHYYYCIICGSNRNFALRCTVVVGKKCIARSTKATIANASKEQQQKKKTKHSQIYWDQPFATKDALQSSPTPSTSNVPSFRLDSIFFVIVGLRNFRLFILFWFRFGLVDDGRWKGIQTECDRSCNVLSVSLTHTPTTFHV